jgi:hypothetical protein
MFDQSSHSKPSPNAPARDDIRFRRRFKKLQHCSSVPNQSHVCRRRLCAPNQREFIHSKCELFSIRTATLRAASIADNFSKRFTKLTRTFPKNYFLATFLHYCHLAMITETKQVHERLFTSLINCQSVL